MVSDKILVAGSVIRFNTASGASSAAAATVHEGALCRFAEPRLRGPRDRLRGQHRPGRRPAVAITTTKAHDNGFTHPTYAGGTINPAG